MRFQDFVPKVIQPGGFLRPAAYESFAECVAEAGAWIQRHGIDVINVETVVLPNIRNPGEEGPADVELHASGEMFSHWYQFVRVWYR